MFRAFDDCKVAKQKFATSLKFLLKFDTSMLIEFMIRWAFKDREVT